jgi:hypothetical protein
MGSRDHNNNGKLYVVAEGVEGVGAMLLTYPSLTMSGKRKKKSKVPTNLLVIKN